MSAPDRMFLTVAQLCARWGNCSSMLIERRMHSDPEFPRPRKLDGGRTRLFLI
jgi:hypothetical protein